MKELARVRGKRCNVRVKEIEVREQMRRAWSESTQRARKRGSSREIIRQACRVFLHGATGRQGKSG